MLLLELLIEFVLLLFLFLGGGGYQGGDRGRGGGGRGGRGGREGDWPCPNPG